MIKIPIEVKNDALLALEFIKIGYKGGTKTGHMRALQLAHDNYIDVKSLFEMRTWFSRHGPDAKNGGTSYRGYCKWLNDGNFNRGAMSWLLWGGDPAYLWLKSPEVRELIESHYPKHKKATYENNLKC